MFTSLQSLDVKAIVELLLVPTCIVLGALTVGIIADRLIRRYINHHLAVEHMEIRLYPLHARRTDLLQLHHRPLLGD